ncbi:hypothetical protein PybrP1_001963 [[Pythium] brassicae (nom. inval.)]|nr:hypothetical protein PybrP1_001963 [[Pythium] brassicae (nom. inval.)]
MLMVVVVVVAAAAAARLCVWAAVRKARVTASLDGKGLLGIVTKPDYASDSDSGGSDSDDLDPSSAMHIDNEVLDPANAKTDAGSPRRRKRRQRASDQDAAQCYLLRCQEARAGESEKTMTKSQKLNSKELRSIEAKARPFFIKTIDDIHALIVKDATSAFGIFKTLCSWYEGTSVRRDPYYI